MPVRVRHRVASVAIALLFTLATAGFVAGCASGPSPISRAPDTAVTPATIDPRFLPGDPNLSLGDCISSVERPGCGNAERTEWRMLTAFGVLLVGLAVIAWRLTIVWRRRDRQIAPAAASGWVHTNATAPPASSSDTELGER